MLPKTKKQLRIEMSLQSETIKVQHIEPQWDCLFVGTPRSTGLKWYDSPTEAISPPRQSLIEEIMAPMPKAGQTKDKTMYNDDDCYETAPSFEKKYLLDRVDSASYEAGNSLRKAFYLENDTEPQTPKDLIARITSGKFEVDSKRMDTKTYSASQALNYFVWRDPAHPADQGGFDAAAAKVESAAKATRDTVAVSDPAAGLAALQAFEGTTFH